MKRLVATGVVSLVLAGCALAQASAESPVQLEKNMVKWIASGQYGKVYDATHLAQQEAVPYSKYFKCETEAMMLAKAMGIDFTTLRFVSSRVAPRQKRVTVSGTHLRVRATVVWMTLSVVEGGKRTNLTPNSPNYFARVDGKWRYIDDQIGNFLKPNCGS